MRREAPPTDAVGTELQEEGVASAEAVTKPTFVAGMCRAEP